MAEDVRNHDDDIELMISGGETIGFPQLVMSAVPVDTLNNDNIVVVPSTRVEINNLSRDESVVVMGEVYSSNAFHSPIQPTANGMMMITDSPNTSPVYEPYEINPSRHMEIDVDTIGRESQYRLSYNLFSAFCRGLSVQSHLQWLIVMLLIYMLVILLIVYGLQLRECQQSEQHDDDTNASTTTVTPCSQIHVFAVSLPLIIIYATHVCISFNSNFFRMLYTSDGGSLKVGNYVAAMCKGAPLIIHTAHCYHYEERHSKRTSTSTSSSTSTPTSTVESDKIQVTKHIDRCQFHYLAFSDQSIIPNIYTYQIVIVEGDVKWDIVNEDINDRYEYEKSLFFQAHRHCDTHHDFQTYGTVKGFEPSMLCCVNPDDVPFAIRHGAMTFRIMTLLGCGWFYRVWLSGVCGKVQVTFRKSIVL